ncbi:MAG: MFS transporter [Burkholderiales bacterium]|nr:MFS transporter [Burkholderiales bacterium]
MRLRPGRRAATENRSSQEQIITDSLKRVQRLRWTAFALGATAFVLAFFHRLAPGAIAGELQHAFATSSASLGLLAATYFYVYFAMQVPSGILADTLGPRKLFTAGALVAGAGSVLFGLAPNFGIALLGRFLVGLGVSVAFISALKLNAAWFSERRFATMTGLLMLIGNMGGLLSTVPLAWVAAHGSWRSVFVGTGVVSIMLAVLTWMFLRDNPRELGLPSMQQLEGKPEYPPARENWRLALATVLANRRTWPGFVMQLGMAGSYLSWGGLWAIPYLRETHAMERQLAALHVSFMVLGLALCSLAVGALSDRIGRRTPLMRVLGCLYVLCWLPWLWGGALPLAVSLGVFALMGATFSAITLVWSCAKEVNPPAYSGMSTSVVNTGGFLGPALLQPLVGLGLDLSSRGAKHALGDWRIGLAVLFAFALMGWLSTFMIVETRCRNIYQAPA